MRVKGGAMLNYEVNCAFDFSCTTANHQLLENSGWRHRLLELFHFDIDLFIVLDNAVVTILKAGVAILTNYVFLTAKLLWVPPWQAPGQVPS
jgi:hypothetical protein